MVRLWLQDPVPPAVSHAERPGRWITQPDWPGPDIAREALPLGRGTLGGSRAGEGGTTMEIKTPLSLGTATGEWNAHGIGPELPGDQRTDDALSVCFDGTPLETDIDIVGTPTCHARLSADQPVATLVARLTMIGPDGASALITWGALNLTHRDGDSEPAALEPGRTYDVTVAMNAIAQRVPAGSRLRLALSTGSWPLLWPAPAETTLALDPAASHLELPILPADLDQPTPADFAPSEIPPPPKLTWLRPFARRRRFVRDVASGRIELILDKDDGAFRVESHGMEVDAQGSERQWITDGDALSGGGEVTWRIVQRRGDWDVAIEARTTVTADGESFFDRGRSSRRRSRRRNLQPATFPAAAARPLGGEDRVRGWHVRRQSRRVIRSRAEKKGPVAGDRPLLKQVLTSIRSTRRRARRLPSTSSR